MHTGKAMSERRLQVGEKWTSIRLSQSTRKQISRYKKGKETYEDVILKALPALDVLKQQLREKRLQERETAHDLT